VVLDNLIGNLLPFLHCNVKLSFFIHHLFVALIFITARILHYLFDAQAVKFKVLVVEIDVLSLALKDLRVQLLLVLADVDYHVIELV
jgi:hypothetical protein